MNQPIRIRFCPNCNTGIQEGLTVCPECGAAQPREQPPRAAQPPVDAPPQDPFGEVFGPGGMPTSQRQVAGSLARTLLGPYVGCLGTGLVMLFAAAFFFGLLLKEPMAVLGVMLLVVGSVGLALTIFLVRLLWDTRPKT